MTQTFDRTAVDLLQNGRAEFYFPNHALVLEVMDGWKNLIRESAGNRSRWAIDRSSFEASKDDREQGFDDGLVCREGDVNVVNGDQFDRKFQMQIKLGLPLLLEACGGPLAPPQKKWIDACMELHGRCVVSMLAVMKELDRIIPGVNFQGLCSARTAMSMHCLRLLYYLRPKVGENNIVGKPHVDRCTFTGHLYDSRRGLKVHTPDGGCEPYVTSSNRALIFPGGKAPVLASQLVPVGHEVCDDEFESAEPRTVAVFFMHTDTPLAEDFVVSRKIPSRRSVQVSFAFSDSVIAA